MATAEHRQLDRVPSRRWPLLQGGQGQVGDVSSRALGEAYEPRLIGVRAQRIPGCWLGDEADGGLYVAQQ